MHLPGGVWDGAQRRREFAFTQVAGEVELALLEPAASPAPLPRRITAVLTTALEHLGDRRPDWEQVHSLPVGDRQFLMRCLAHVLGHDSIWLAPTCEACHQRFDVQLDQSRLPVKDAGASFPFATAETSWGHCRLRVPTGADQEAAASISDDREATRVLARRCVVAPEPGDDRELDDDDVSRIEQALEACAPEVATVAETRCPECGHPNRIYIDPYTCLTAGPDALWDEIHELATAYHWSERDILGLPRERRRTYLRRIARSHGLAGATAAGDGSEL